MSYSSGWMQSRSDFEADASRIEAGLRAWEILRPSAPKDHYCDLAASVRASGGVVGIVGLFNRGKSTLFNQLVGRRVSPTSVVPETAIPIEAVTGPRAARGWVASKQVRLPRRPRRFARRVARKGARSGLKKAEVSGRFRLPPGVRLVDTPGVGADDRKFGETWRASGANAAVVVLSCPPGAAAEDLALVAAADQHFGGPVTVALKAISEDIGPDDLAEVGDYVSELLGRSVIRLPAVPSPMAWGADAAWQPLEAEIERLAKQAEERAAERASCLSRDLDELAAWVAGATWCRTELKKLLRARPAAERWGAELAPAVAAALAAARHDRRSHRFVIAAVAMPIIVVLAALGGIAARSLTARPDAQLAAAHEVSPQSATSSTTSVRPPRQISTVPSEPPPTQPPAEQKDWLRAIALSDEDLDPGWELVSEEDERGVLFPCEPTRGFRADRVFKRIHRLARPGAVHDGALLVNTIYDVSEKPALSFEQFVASSQCGQYRNGYGQVGTVEVVRTGPDQAELEYLHHDSRAVVKTAELQILIHGERTVTFVSLLSRRSLSADDRAVVSGLARTVHDRADRS